MSKSAEEETIEVKIETKTKVWQSLFIFRFYVQPEKIRISLKSSDYYWPAARKETCKASGPGQ